MNTFMKYCLHGATALVLLAGASGAFAQGDDQWAINGDVDNDGIVGPTDIQHVINDALGLNEQGEDALRLPLRHYIVASPRVSLALRPGANPEAPEPCDVAGAATNFQRENGRLVVRKDTAIAFRFDRNLEGVWHDRACGTLRTSLTVEIRRVENPEAEEGAAEGKGEGEEPEWHLVGRDIAAGNACGPAIGTADIAVRRRFEEVGHYMVRCTIRSAALPASDTPDERNECGVARDVDTVMVLVRVVDHEEVNDDIEWQTENDPATVGSRFGNPMDDESEEGEEPLP